MVSLWPWRVKDTSPASFEKALSALATKIANTQARLDGTRSAARRTKVLWTLYLSFAYLVYAIVLVLVVGWAKMGPWEWAGVAGGPLVIYGTRVIVATFFSFRIDSLETKLKVQQTERAKTIQKLKDATKYDSTQELLKKYGGAEAKADGEREGKKTGGRGKKDAAAHGTPNRTNMPPPPTANIPRGDGRSPAPVPGSPQQPGTPSAARQQPPPSPSPSELEVTAEFAPNAFNSGVASSPVASVQYVPAPGPTAETHWYDRIMDLLLGEDEMAAKNRIVLICRNCRLVNGRAPPGTASLAELGLWKCMACGTVNGEVDEGKRIVKEVLGASEPAKNREAAAGNSEADGDSSDFVETDAGGGEDQDGPREHRKLPQGPGGTPAGVRQRKSKGKA